MYDKYQQYNQTRKERVKDLLITFLAILASAGLVGIQVVPSLYSLWLHFTQ